MALKQSGIELVAKDAEQWFRTMKQVNAVYAESRRQAEQTAKSFTNFEDEVSDVSKGLKDAGKSAQTAGQKMKDAGNDAKKGGDGVKSFGSTIGDLLGSFPLLELGAVGALGAAATAAISFANESIEAFGAYENRFAEVATLLPDLDNNGLAQLKAQALDLGAEIGRTSDELLPAMYQALSAGVPANNVFNFLEQANRAAVGGVTDLETSVDTLTSVVNAYGEDVLSVAQASDQIFTAVALGKTTFGEIGAAISNVAPLAATLGVEFSNLAAGIATITSTGASTSSAVTQLRAVLTELAKPTTVISKFFARLTGQSFPEFIASGGDLSQALTIISQGAEDSGLQMAELFSSVEALNAALVLGVSKSDDYASAIETVSTNVGVTDEAVSKFAGTVEEQNRKLAAQEEQLKILTGEAILPLKTALNDTTISALGLLSAQAKLDLAGRELRSTILDLNLGWIEGQKIFTALKEEIVDGRVVYLDQEAATKRVIIANQLLSEGFLDTVDAGESVALALDRAVNAIVAQELATERAVAMNEFYAGSNETARESVALLGLSVEELAEAEKLIDPVVRNATQATEEITFARELSADAAEEAQEATLLLYNALRDGNITQDQYNQLLNEGINTTEAAKDAIGGIVEANREAIAAQEEYNRTLTAYFVEALEAEEQTINLSAAFYESADAQGASAEQMAVFGVITQEFSEEQAIAALQTALLRVKIDELTASVIAGNISYQDAVIQAASYQAALASADISIDTATQSTMGLAEAIKGLPADVPITFTDNADEGIANANRVKQAADAAAGEREIRFRVTGDPIPTGDEATGGVPQGFALGGPFRAGQPFFAGDAPGGAFTPFTELIVPQTSGMVVANNQLETAVNVLRSGILGSANLPSNISNTTITNNRAGDVVNNNRSVSVEFNASYANPLPSIDRHDLLLLGGIL